MFLTIMNSEILPSPYRAALGRSLPGRVHWPPQIRKKVVRRGLVFGPFEWYLDTEKKVLLDRTRNFCSFRAIRLYIIINKQRNSPFLENEWKKTVITGISR